MTTEAVTTEDCKRTLEFEIPREEIEHAEERIANSYRTRARLPGFRPGKAPLSMIRARFDDEIRTQVIEDLVPKAFRERVGREDWKVVGSPTISDLHFDAGEPIRFKAEFEVAPEFELGEYRGVPAKYEEPVVSDEEVATRLESMRENKAEFPNLDPRPLENNDFVLVHLRSIDGLADPIDQDVQIEIGGAETLPAFTEGLLGMSPDETKQVTVTYPAEFGQERLAGKTVVFELTPRFVRRKELPALDDEFARDLGDYGSLDELRDAVRKTLYFEKQRVAQEAAREELIDHLVAAHAFAVPDAYVQRQVENEMRAQLRELTGRDIDPAELKLDWKTLRQERGERAVRNIRASLLLEKIAERESIGATKEEVDREVQRIARQQREPVPVTRARLEKEGRLAQIAGSIRTDRTLQFLFDQAEKHA